MIVASDFIWLHFPKCAGHAVERALRQALRGRRDVTFDRRWPHHPGWHESVTDREWHEQGFARHGRTVICGFRRLPHWMLSRVHFEASRPPYRTPTRDMLRRGEFFHQNGEVGGADQHAVHFGGSSVDRWIRTEHLAEDFERHFTDILGHRAKLALGRVNKVVNATPLNYIKALEFHFTPGDLEALYKANPVWAGIERELYGSLLTL
jgi:hypothetical protein